ncbi:MAG: hypothetical protein LBM98_08565 [Oscillospiraceae bacterium]|nr:hypothetical protein [Oscillospiraceae bacterium]
MRPRTARGNHPAPAGAPLHRGDGVWTGLRNPGKACLAPTYWFNQWGGFETRPYVTTHSNVQTPVLIPSVEGCRPQAAGWFSPQDATHVQNQSSLISDI